MRLGRASAYGMLAMMEIAQQAEPPRHHPAHRHANGNGNANGHGPAAARARASRISQATGIPVEYLRKVLQRLTRARLVISERGRGGGFRLARPCDRVSLLEIIEAIEGPIDEVAILTDALLQCRAGRAHPQLRRWRKQASKGLRDLLAGTSLADLMD
jgi:Rrf2 family protein